MLGASSKGSRKLRMLLIASLGCHLLATPPALYYLGRPNETEAVASIEASLELTPDEERTIPNEDSRPLMESFSDAPRPLADRWAASDLVPPEAPALTPRPALDWYPRREAVPLDVWKVPSAKKLAGPDTPALTPPPPAPGKPAEPATPRISDSPPPALVSGLGNGYLTALPGDAILSDAARNELRERVYARHSYPREAVDLELEGDVTVRFRLDAEGAPIDVEAVEPQEGLTLLEEQAVRMVREGGPYPLPDIRRKVEFYVAVAILNTEEAGAVRSLVVRPSGLDAVDRFATRLAGSDVGASPEPGWKVVPFKVLATLQSPGSSGDAAVVRVIELDGDERWRGFLEANSSRLGAPRDSSDYFSIPIRFRFSD